MPRPKDGSDRSAGDRGDRHELWPPAIDLLTINGDPSRVSQSATSLCPNIIRRSTRNHHSYPTDVLYSSPHTPEAHPWGLEGRGRHGTARGLGSAGPDAHVSSGTGAEGTTPLRPSPVSTVFPHTIPPSTPSTGVPRTDTRPTGWITDSRPTWSPEGDATVRRTDGRMARGRAGTLALAAGQTTGSGQGGPGTWVCA